jgi:probable F420-dependent oxidoreductase
MEIGVVFPQTEVAAARSRAAVEEFIGAMADSGVRHVTAGYHDLGVPPSAQSTDWADHWPLKDDRTRRPYTHEDAFHDLFVLYGYIAARLDVGFLTGLVVLPQRQTVSVAKAAASLDILTTGNLRLGAGVGWNRPEVEAMGGRFAERGAVLDEQIHVLRELWTKDVVEIRGRYHDLVGVGICPLPLQRPIPIWLGSGPGERSAARVGSLGDGWIPQVVPGHGFELGWSRVRAAALAAGRNPEDIQVQGVIHVGHGDRRRIEHQARRWKKAGASHLALDVRWSPDRDPARTLRATAPVLESVL